MPLRDLRLLCLRVLRNTLTVKVEVPSTALGHELPENDAHNLSQGLSKVHRQCQWDTPERGIAPHSTGNPKQHLGSE